jgi:mRNA interferase RelE/StbE
MYRVEFTTAADRDLQRLARRASQRDYEAVEAAIDTLAEDPRPHGSAKLTGERGYRIRVRRFRVIYSVDDRARLVVVARVLPRGQAYR